MTGFWTAYFLMQLPAGMVSDKIGIKRTLVMMSLLIGVFCFLTGSATGYPDLLALRFINGLTCGFMFAPGQSLILRWFGEREKTLASGLYVTAPYIGITVPMLASPIIALHFGSWRYAFWIFAALPILAAAMDLIVIKEPPTPKSPSKPQTFHTRGSSSTPSFSSATKSVLKSKALWYNCLARFGIIFSTIGATSWAPKYLVSQLNFSIVNAGLVSVLLPLPGLLGAPLGGVVADRVIGRRAPSLFFGLSTTGLMAIVIAFSPTIPMLVMVGFFLFGLFNAFSEAPALGMLNEFGFDRKVLGTAAGLSNFIAQIGGAVAPAMLGVVLDQTASFVHVWMTLGMLPLVLSVFAALLARKGY